MNEFTLDGAWMNGNQTFAVRVRTLDGIVVSDAASSSNLFEAISKAFQRTTGVDFSIISLVVDSRFGNASVSFKAHLSVVADGFWTAKTEGESSNLVEAIASAALAGVNMRLRYTAPAPVA